MVRVEEEESFRIVSLSSHDYNSGPKRVGEDEDVDSSNDDTADIRLGKRKQLDSLAKQDDLSKQRSDDRDANTKQRIGEFEDRANNTNNASPNGRCMENIREHAKGAWEGLLCQKVIIICTYY